MKKKRINFFKYILSFTIFRRWKTVHKAEECPSPSGFAMVLQNASGIATTIPASCNDGNTSAHCGQQYIDTDAIGYDGDGNGNDIRHNINYVLSAPSSSSSIHSPTTDCNRNRIVAKVDEAKCHHHESSKLVIHGNSSTNTIHSNSNNQSTSASKRQHPAASGKGVCTSFFSSARSSSQPQNDGDSCRRTKAHGAGCRMSMVRWYILNERKFLFKCRNPQELIDIAI